MKRLSTLIPLRFLIKSEIKSYTTKVITRAGTSQEADGGILGVIYGNINGHIQPSTVMRPVLPTDMLKKPQTNQPTTEPSL